MVEFNEEEHIYKENGHIYPSVTQILKRVGIIDTRWYSEASAQRGTNIHEIINRIGDKLDPLIFLDIDSEYTGYISAYARFLEDNNLVIIESENPKINFDYEYAGKPDIIGRLNNKKCIIDVKTGSQERWHGIQLTAYKLLLPKNNIQALYGLYLQKDEKYRLVEYLDKDYRDIWFSALTLYKWLEG